MGNSRTGIYNGSRESNNGYIALTLTTNHGEVVSHYYNLPKTTEAVIWVGGVGGNFDTPADNLYPKLCQQLLKERISSLRIAYRCPQDLRECVLDVIAGIEFLEQNGVTKIGLVGHSMGGAVVVQAALITESVKTVVTLASQAYGADEVFELPEDCSILLIHGASDEILPAACSTEVYMLAHRPKELILYDGAGHLLDEVADKVYEQVKKWLIKELKTTHKT